MRYAAVWFVMTCKRYLKKMSFLLILLVLPVVAWGIHKLESEDEAVVRVAVCVQTGEGTQETSRVTGQEDSQETSVDAGQEDSLEWQLVQRLTGGEAERGERLFRFYLCDTEEQLKADVASRKAECGYAISQELRQKLDQKAYKRSIRVYSAPSTVLASLSTEVVFAALMELYDRKIFVDYIVDSITEQNLMAENPSEITGIVENDRTFKRMRDEVGAIYDKWLNGGETFHFVYQYQDVNGNAVALDTENTRVFPVRGMIAVYLFITGLYSAVMLGMDEKKGLFHPLSPGKRVVCRFAVLAAPVSLAGISGLAALAAGGELTRWTALTAGEEVIKYAVWAKEVIAMAVYVAVVCGFAYGVKCICRKPEIICCAIPFFVVGSLLFAPVFVDIGKYVPAVAWVGKLFLPTWYLKIMG